MYELTDFLENMQILFTKVNGRQKLIVTKYGPDVSFHIAGQAENAILHTAEFCSPNTVAAIVARLGFELSSEEVVKISNAC